ncbi:MAG TPA: Trx7/PDZ domain-containing (seleno)protein [Planctomycetota bacterium]|nr:Trx7/PDZ domain-containing (seleno)protein [Planctomycetota bacterium]
MRHGPTPSLVRTLWVALALIASVSSSFAQDRAELVRRDLESFLEHGLWIYNDLDKGFEEARKTGKPLAVVLRCIPCEACRGFDEQVAELHPRIRSLLDKFVRVRIPQANGLDLSIFQFDYDLSFYAFFFHPDGSIYGRFGSRSTQEDKSGETSVAAFEETLRAVLELHERYAEVRDSLRSKKGPKPDYPVPEKIPPLEGRYGAELDYEGKVVQSCIHCHQIRDSERQMVRDARKAIPDTVLFPYPSPSVVGLELDPKKRATVVEVSARSPAEKAGFHAGDEIMTLEEQPIISVADIEWILHHAKDGETLEATVRRDGEDKERSVSLRLPEGWRARSDISWRVSTWDLRRMGTGGLRLEELTDAERKEHGIAPGKLALRAKHVGQYGEHATAKRAGFEQGDIIVAIDGSDERRTESELIAYTVQKKRPGDRLELEVLRRKERRTFAFDLR